MSDVSPGVAFICIAFIAFTYFGGAWLSYKVDEWKNKKKK
jgi:hypothetical protein